MRIAVLGSGYAGLSVTWHFLLHTQGNASVDMFDPVPLGEGPSGLSSGLLHFFHGAKALKLPFGEAAMTATHKLITNAGNALKKNVIISQGILRPSNDDEQIACFKKRAEEYPEDLEWWDQATCNIICPQLTLPSNAGSLFIKKGLTLDNDAYLEGLWLACSNQGTQFYDEVIEDLEQFKEFYDLIVITPGANFNNLSILQKLPLTPVKGQLLKISWPEGLNPLPFSINAKKYMVAKTFEKFLILGATFEHNQKDDNPDLEIAKQNILPKLLPMFPILDNCNILDCFSGIRASTPTKLPLVTQIEEKIWVFAGLGSKGLLYHAFVGNMLAQAALSKDRSYIAKEFSYFPNN